MIQKRRTRKQIIADILAEIPDNVGRLPKEPDAEEMADLALPQAYPQAAYSVTHSEVGTRSGETPSTPPVTSASNRGRKSHGRTHRFPLFPDYPEEVEIGSAGVNIQRADTT